MPGAPLAALPGMTTDRERIEATQGERVRREYHDRRQAERAVERLKAGGFGDDQITLSTHGGRTGEDGVFVPGGIELIVMAEERADEAERILGAD